ncbi:hypothetical protein [Aeromicrobium sp. WCS2018Hpa-33]|uniref:hypothetical protein n=1 Tax=Aeromicrobium sp. WCS2018Hpa-33 TaxID=3073629 RepID=UPI002882E259|nr:hypothetical protein [Aeromicrobium sp. WCS2018Hpa-33]
MLTWLRTTALLSVMLGAGAGLMVGVPGQSDAGRAQLVAAVVGLIFASYAALDKWETVLSDDAGTQMLRMIRPRLKLAVPMFATGTAIAVTVNTAFTAASLSTYLKGVAGVAVVAGLLVYVLVWKALPKR